VRALVVLDDASDRPRVDAGRLRADVDAVLDQDATPRA
jgi:hypothetical protein